MLKSLFAACLIFTTFVSPCQITIEGKVIGQKSKQPIPFANIGIFKSNIGTLSNEDGSFSFRIPETLQNDSVTFSSLGFEKKTLAVKAFSNSSVPVTVSLPEKAVLLNEVSVSEKREKAMTFQLGNTAVSGGVLQTDTAYAGRSVALLIDNKNPKTGREFPLYLGSAGLRILRKNLGGFRFRIRINDVDEKTGLPGNDLLQQSVIVESTMRSGWLEFDLSSLNMIVSKPFFITFEQLTTKEDRIAIINGYNKYMREHPDRVKYDTIIIDGKKTVRQVFKKGGIDIPGTFIGTAPLEKKFTCYVREVSFGEWEKVRGIVAGTVILSTQPVKKK
ncbi:hypothetical protein WSM22_44980 [Cytophagales bacterium WSM2-2]|nr:hypothetical protein WSM22_44980 [Cytophagales bacterium WSM2-2]